MELLVLPLTIFAFLFGIALVLHGPRIVTIHKHYHVKKEDEN